MEALWGDSFDSGDGEGQAENLERPIRGVVGRIWQSRIRVGHKRCWPLRPASPLLWMRRWLVLFSRGVYHSCALVLRYHPILLDSASKWPQGATRFGCLCHCCTGEYRGPGCYFAHTSYTAPNLTLKQGWRTPLLQASTEWVTLFPVPFCATALYLVVILASVPIGNPVAIPDSTLNCRILFFVAVGSPVCGIVGRDVR